jgi:hypothetical protein
MGHVHFPTHILQDGLQDGQKDGLQDRAPAREFLVIGDWLDNYTYVVLEKGRFRLMRWTPDGEDKRIAWEPPPKTEAPTRS